MSVLITGSSKGLGAELANKMHSAGHSVLTHRRNATTRMKPLGNTDVVTCDLLKLDEIEKSFTALLSKKIEIKHLICNAGKSSYPNTGIESLLNIQTALNDNLLVTSNTVYSALKFFRHTLKTVTVIGSICGEELINGAPFEYSLAKSSLKSFTKLCSHLYVSAQIRFNMITPGNLYFEGSVWEKKEKLDQDTFNSYLKANVPSNMIGTPSDIHHAIEYLIADDAKFINGANLIIDGGQMKKW
jgi:3-oxoacyl-[acyl-carrier protein] reductase